MATSTILTLSPPFLLSHKPIPKLHFYPSKPSPVRSKLHVYPSKPLQEKDRGNDGDRFRKLLLCSVACSLAACGPAIAAEGSIRASGIGLEVAAALRKLGFADAAVVFALATLPVIELRGAIPVGYWMQLHPLHLTVLAILGNMVPVPIIVLYLKKFASFLSKKNSPVSRFLDKLFKRAKEKAGPVEEFQWLGLMLFVAVPFPGTGAWTGAFIAAILDMPFWSAVSANFFGVVLAGLLVNLLVNLGIKYAIVVGVLLFFLSTVMWSILRQLKMSLNQN